MTTQPDEELTMPDTEETSVANKAVNAAEDTSTETEVILMLRQNDLEHLFERWADDYAAGVLTAPPWARPNDGVEAHVIARLRGTNSEFGETRAAALTECARKYASHCVLTRTVRTF
jgi:hypothetical protein